MVEILTDIYSNIIDSVSWNSASDDGRSIERDDVEDIYSGWHDCYDPEGSTPGRVNSVVPSEGENSFSVNIEPVALSRGNIDNRQFKIDVIIPPGSRLSVDVYDETGYKVKSIVEDQETAVSTLYWNGRDDDGSALSPGLYIISFDLSGQKNNEKSKVVVIAP